MNSSVGPMLSATVWVRSVSGLEPRPEIAITAGNIADYDADPNELARVVASFHALGFEIEAGQGPMFSITANKELFESTFVTSLAIDDDGGLADRKAREEGLELPISRLPEELQAALWRVLFSPRPIFFEQPDNGSSFDY